MQMQGGVGSAGSQSPPREGSVPLGAREGVRQSCWGSSRLQVSPAFVDPGEQILLDPQTGSLESEALEVTQWYLRGPEAVLGP